MSTLDTRTTTSPAVLAVRYHQRAVYWDVAHCRHWVHCQRRAIQLIGMRKFRKGYRSVPRDVFFLLAKAVLSAYQDGA